MLLPVVKADEKALEVEADLCSAGPVGNCDIRRRKQTLSLRVSKRAGGREAGTQTVYDVAMETLVLDPVTCHCCLNSGLINEAARSKTSFISQSSVSGCGHTQSLSHWKVMLVFAGGPS